MVQKPKPLSIVYVAGSMRSGSTLLGEALGSSPGVVHLGEIRGFYHYVNLNSSRCSCGKEFKDCYFWKKILRSLFGPGWKNSLTSVAIDSYFPVANSINWRQLLPDSKIGFTTQVRHFRPIFEAALFRSKSSVAIDSSKSAPFALFFSQLPGVKMVIVHLARDPRGFVFSMTHNPIRMYSHRTGTVVKKTTSFCFAVLHWLKSNTAALLLGLSGVPIVRISYEEFTRRPKKTIRKILAFAKKNGISIRFAARAIDLLSRHKTSVKGHLVGSNPGVKAHRGILPIKNDDQWRSTLLPSTRFLYTILLLPLILIYKLLWKNE